MKEENNKQQQSSRQEEEKQSTTTSSKWKTLMRKKWFFPAVYLAAAALILAFITWYQNPDDYAIDPDEFGYDAVEEDTEDASRDENALPVSGHEEDMSWPVAEEAQADVVIGYYDDEASKEDQAQSVVEYEQTFTPNEGLDFAREDGETFDVMAAMSGEVVAVGNDPLVGQFVEIDHGDDLVTVYQGLDNVQVSDGDSVQKGDVVAEAGRSVFRQNQGVHLHFEVREEGVSVNPHQYFSTDDARAEEEQENESDAENEETDADAEDNAENNNE
jgi:stage II sporulation protein Q